LFSGGAPDGWNSARFLEILLTFGSFLFSALFSTTAGNAGSWAFPADGFWLF
jgi:hypothetical protein